MKREARLQSAVHWLKEIQTTRIIRSYHKRFGVDIGTAIAELRTLGVQLSEQEVIKAREGTKSRQIMKQKRKEKRLLQHQTDIPNALFPDSDATYAYIAGYTGWGFPYGITWEEMERFADEESLDATLPPRSETRKQYGTDKLDHPPFESDGPEEVSFDLEQFMSMISSEMVE